MKNDKIVKRARLSLMLAFRNKFLRKTLACWCALATLATMCGPAWAAVATGDYLGGAANLNRVSSNIIDNYGSQTATYAGFTGNGGTGVLDWNKFNVPSGTEIEFNSGTFYNVINSAGGMSTIAGAISGTAEANVYIFNPNGVVFNSGSSVNVSGIFGAFATGVSGTTLDNWIIKPSAVPDAIKFATMTGDITVEGGTFKASQIALAGKNVSVKGGTFNNQATLAAGDKVTIDGFAGATISMTIPDTAMEGDIDMLGTFAETLEAKAADDVTVANGDLMVTEDLTVTTSGDDTMTKGAFIVNNAHVQAKSIDANVLGDVQITGKTTVETTAGDLKLVAQKGQVSVAGSLADTATVQAVGGDMTVSAQTGVFVSDKAQIVTDKGTTSDKGNLTVISSENDPWTGKAIDESANAKVVVAGDATFTATAGDISLNGTVTATEGDVMVTAVNGSVTVAGTVKAGEIDEATPAFGTKTGNLSIEAEKSVTFASGAKAGANGTVTVKANGTDAADGLFLDNAKLVANDAMTLDAVKAIEIKNGAYVGGMKTIKIGGTTAPETLTVTGDGTALVAKGDLTATASAIDVKESAKVATDKSMSLTTTTGDITVGSGAKLLADGAVGLTAKQNLRIENGAEVAAKGEGLTSVAAVYMSTGSGDVTIDGGDAGVATVRAGTETEPGAATIWANGKVDIANGAQVDATGNVSVRSMSNEATTEDNVTVRGENTLVKAGDEAYLYAQNGNVTVKDEAAVSADNRASLETQAGDVVVSGSATVEGTAEYAQAVAWEGNVKLSDGATVSGNKALLTSKTVGNVTVEDATLSSVNESVIETLAGDIAIEGASTIESTAGDVLVTSVKDATVTGTSSIEAGHSATIYSSDAGDITIDTTGTVTAGSGDVTAETENGDILVEKATVVSNQGDVRVIALAENEATIQGGATVKATEGNILIYADDIVIGDAEAANETSVKAGENISIESPNGSIDILSKVTAGKSLAIVSETETAGSEVKIDAKNLTDKNILTAQDGSIYIDAKTSDIALNNGAVIAAKQKTKADASSAGNILIQSESGSVAPTEGTAKIVADGGKGAAVIAGGGEVGSKNLTIKAAVAALRSTDGGEGAAAEMPDVVAAFEGDTEFAAKASNDIAVDIQNGTLTIVSSAESLAGETVNTVKYPLPETPTSPVEVEVEAYSLDLHAKNASGVEAGNDIQITGRNANLVVADNSYVLAGNDTKINLDGQATVSGTVQSGRDVVLEVGGNLSTPGAGKIVAGRDFVADVGSSTPQVNVAVGKGLSATSGERAIAFTTVGGNGNPEIYGNDSRTAVFVDGRVAGGNSADYSILQGYEQAAALGNVVPMPVFALMGNLSPLTGSLDLQSSAASFVQSNMTSDKGTMEEVPAGPTELER